MSAEANCGTFISQVYNFNNLSVALYGAGGRGAEVRAMIEARGGMVRFFVDSFKRGRLDGLEVIGPDELPERQPEVDLILIASVWWREIERELVSRRVEKYAVLAPYNVSGVVFTEGEQQHFSNDFKACRLLLCDERSIALYDELLSSRFCRPDLRELERCTSALELRSPVERQYLDYVNFTRIKTIIEGGVWDGANTRDFLHRMNSGGLIYGFEPDSVMAAKLDSGKGMRLERMALWNCSTTLFFNGDNPGCGSCTEFGEAAVQAVSIDDYVRENEIQDLDFIKMDIEGAEMKALEGGWKTIRKHRPQLAISIYHSKDDFRNIPLMLGTLEDYKHYIGHYSATACETIWYAIPSEIETGGLPK